MPALLGLAGNLEMTLASRLSTAVSVLYRSGHRASSGTTEPDQRRHCRPFSAAQVRKVGPGLEKGSGRSRAGCLGPCQSGAPCSAWFPGSGFWRSQPPLDSCPTLLRSPPVTVCAASPGEHHAGPFTCTAGGLSDLQPCSAAGPSRARPQPPPTPASPLPHSSLLFCKGIEEEGRLVHSSHPPTPQPLRSAVGFGD